MNAQLLAYLAAEMSRAMNAPSKREADEILMVALTTAQAWALSN